MKTVKILIGAWIGSSGLLMDKIPDSPWYNVIVSTSDGQKIRLALKATDFEECK